MSDISRQHRVDPEIAESLVFHAGHYATAVAAALLADGMPVHQVISEPPMIERSSGGDERFYEAGADIMFGEAFAAVVSPGPDLALVWDGQSGWVLYPHLDPDDMHAGARWLADGLVPPPERVATFMLTAQVSFESAGSGRRPFYRREVDDYDGLLDELEPYVPEGDSSVDYDWSERFRSLQSSTYHRRIVDDLAVDVDDPIIDLPLRRSEIRALIRMLDLLEARSIGGSELIAALAMDLSGRIPGERGSADQHRRAWLLARNAKDRREGR